MKWIIVGVALLVGVGALVLLVGMLLPVAHVASVSRELPAQRERVWSAITGVEEFPSWRAGLRDAERVSGREGQKAWRETSKTGAMTLEVVREEPPRLLELRIADEDLPFGGTWTYELTPVDGGTRLTITERGEVYNPFFRFMARFVFGYEGTIRTYLESLTAHLESQNPETG